MQKNRANSIDDSGWSIQEAANALGLDAFTVHALIQRRKLTADVTHCGELMVPHTEVQRLLGGQAANPERSFNLC
jgi:hypothetical protein